MAQNLLTLSDLTHNELSTILKESMRVKSNPEIYTGKLQGKQIGLIFEKPSTRTRVSLEVGISQMGANAIYLGNKDLQISRGENIKDTAKVLSRFVDALVVRSNSHETQEELARYANVPIINALSDYAHPLQVFADFTTIIENGLELENSHMTFMGDCNNNVCKSLLRGASYTGLTFTLGAPEKYLPDEAFINELRKNGSVIHIQEDPAEAIKSADVVYTDVWVSMGDEDEAIQRKTDLKQYQINNDLLAKAEKDIIVLHCLPAEYGQEITEDVVNSKYSRIYDQAENRLHSVKAVLGHFF